MAPLPEEGTARVWLDYTTQGNQHSLMTRWKVHPEGIMPVIQDFYETFLNALTDFRVTDWEMIGMRFAPKNVTFSLPLPVSIVLDPGEATPNNVSQVMSLNFVGRGSQSGRRVVWQVFGTNWAADPDFRLTAAEDARVLAACSALGTATANDLCTISEDTPIIYLYANQRFNGYWQTESRGS